MYFPPPPIFICVEASSATLLGNSRFVRKGATLFIIASQSCQWQEMRNCSAEYPEGSRPEDKKGAVGWMKCARLETERPLHHGRVWTCKLGELSIIDLWRSFGIHLRVGPLPESKLDLAQGLLLVTMQTSWYKPTPLQQEGESAWTASMSRSVVFVKGRSGVADRGGGVWLIACW